MFKNKDWKECNEKIQQWQKECRSSIFNNSTIDSCAELQKEGRNMFSSTTIDKRYPPEEPPSAKYMREHQKDWEERDKKTKDREERYKKIQERQKLTSLFNNSPIDYSDIGEKVKEARAILEKYKQMKKEDIQDREERYKKIQERQKLTPLFNNPPIDYSDIREKVKEARAILEEYKQMKKEYIDYLRNRWI